MARLGPLAWAALASCLLVALAAAQNTSNTTTSFVSVSSLPSAVIGLWQRRDFEIEVGNRCNSSFFASDYLNFKIGERHAPNVTAPFIVQYLNCEDNSRIPFAGKAYLSPNITTAACGQDMPRQYAYGVLGMNTYEVQLPVVPDSREEAIEMLKCLLNGTYTLDVTNNFQMCLYFNRFGVTNYVANVTSSTHEAAALGLFAAKAPSEWIASTPAGEYVQCPAEIPYGIVELVPLGVSACVDRGIDPHSCVTISEAQCTADSNNRYSIGVGMSVSGIFVILISLGAVVVLPKILKIKDV